MDHKNLLQGIEEAKSGNYETAANYLTKAVQTDPNNVKAWILLGHCLTDGEKSRYCYQKALTIDPANEIAKISLKRLDTPSVQKTPQFELSPSAEVDSSIAKPRAAFPIRIFLGLILTLVLCAVATMFFIRSGRLNDGLTQWVVNATPTPVLISPAATIGAPANQADIDFYIAQAEQLMASNQCDQAIDHLTRVIEFSGENHTAYAMRGRCYYYLSLQENSLDAYNSELRNALKDIDQAIALHPQEANYYTIRSDALSDYSVNLPYQSDRAYILGLAVENEKTYLAMSTDVQRKLSISALMAKDMVDGGQCEEGMELIKELETKILPGDGGNYGCLLCARAAAHACLGDMDLAVQDMETMLRGNKPGKSTAYFETLYLYQAGRSDEALAILNDSLSQDPTFGGTRYYVRALINLDMGNTELALQDLRLGENYGWDRGGLYAYIKAKLALEEGNKEDAIAWLQFAEASFTPYSSGLRKQVQDELEKLDAPVLEIQSQVYYPSTPMPPIKP